MGGHQDVSRTYARMSNKYFVPGALEKIPRLVAKCESCQQAPRFNAKRSDINFELGNLVLEWSSVTPPGLVSKLCRKWLGPFVILEKLSPVTYKNGLMIGHKKPRVVHVEELKIYPERAEYEIEIEFENKEHANCVGQDTSEIDRKIPDYIFDENEISRPPRNVTLSHQKG